MENHASLTLGYLLWLFRKSVDPEFKAMALNIILSAGLAFWRTS